MTDAIVCYTKLLLVNFIFIFYDIYLLNQLLTETFSIILYTSNSVAIKTNLTKRFNISFRDLIFQRKQRSAQLILKPKTIF